MDRLKKESLQGREQDKDACCPYPYSALNTTSEVRKNIKIKVRKRKINCHYRTNNIMFCVENPRKYRSSIIQSGKRV